MQPTPTKGGGWGKTKDITYLILICYLYLNKKDCSGYPSSSKVWDHIDECEHTRLFSLVFIYIKLDILSLNRYISIPPRNDALTWRRLHLMLFVYLGILIAKIKVLSAHRHSIFPKKKWLL